ncbi:hypothetical protein LPJ53_003466 [Coemansia erecta]|uniref:Uncharacterized protein n=1 Tax=Coemansia erecta TaxID=147472 RepID=A0A9W8CSR3_9FUNG|nr:hypothetical protein LPJ53_003466 [Coemansia erecta]
MLKAFSKVFHKSQGHADEQLKGGPAHVQVSGAALQQPDTPQPNLRRTPERQNYPAESGAAYLQRRNAGEDAQPRAFVPEGGGGRPPEPSRRVSLQKRIEQQLQPRLHMKSPGSSQSADGRFALTADNIEWHLRMIPPMKESKYDRILRYVKAQQQNVSAAADPAMQQHLHDIDSSMLMGGQINHEYGVPGAGLEYMDPAYHSVERQMVAQQQLYLQQQQQQMNGMNAATHSAFGTASAGVPMIVPTGAVRSVHPNAQGGEHELGQSGHAFQPVINAANAMLSQEQQLQGQTGHGTAPPPVNHTNTNQTTNTAASGQRDSGLIPPPAAPAAAAAASAATPATAVHDNEEDDNTPLAAINVGTSPRQQPALSSHRPGSLSIAAGSSLEKYIKEGPLDEPLPDPISPNHAARLSMMSFGSNVAVQLNSETHALSRSHSLSNPHSASIYGSHYRSTPVAHSPTVQDVGAQYVSTNSGSARQSSFPSAQVQTRPSMDALAAYARERGFSNARSESDDNRPLNAQPKHRISGDGDDQVFSSVLSAAVAAGLVDQPANIGDDDDDDDDVPLRPSLSKPGDRVPGDAGGTPEEADAVSELESVSSIALRVANPSSSSRESDQSADEEDITDERGAASPRQARKSASSRHNAVALDPEDDEDDNQPLGQLPRKPSNVQQLYIKTRSMAGHTNADDEDDDDQPLSGLLLQPAAASDDLGSLPLPMPRRVVDPDAVSNMDEMFNESARAMRSSVSGSPTSPVVLPRGAVRKHSLLLHSSKPGRPAEADQDQEASSARVAAGTDRRSHSEKSIAAAHEQPASVNRRSNLSAFAQKLVVVEDESISDDTDSDDDAPIVASAAEAARIHRENGWDKVDTAKDVERPWATQRTYSASTSSLNGAARRTQRGSTLGQQLTDELQRVREGLARSRFEDEKSERRSWQVGDDIPPVKQPWVKHQENTLSESALSKATVDAAGMNTISAHIRAGDIDSGDSLHPSSWTYADKQRPLSTQYLRAPRWITKHLGGAGNGGGGSNAEMGGSRMIYTRSQSTEEVAPASTSPQSTKSFSFSSRLNTKLGKLKRSFKPATPDGDTI